MASWMKNYLSIIEEEKAGSCPYCKRDDLELDYYVSNKEKGTGILHIKCNSCGEQDMVCRVPVPEKFR